MINKYPVDYYSSNRVKKLVTHGGAVAACVYIDCYSDYTNIILVKNVIEFH
jgi:hypothetical protein